MTRIAISVFSGILIALSLFWVMQAMISHNPQHLQSTDNLHMTEFVRLKRDTQLHSKNRQIPEQPKPKKKPIPPKLSTYKAKLSAMPAPEMHMPNLDIPIQTNSFNHSVLTGLQAGTGTINTNIIPLVRIPPTYPIRAARRRIEGWVKIEFTISTDGTVQDAVVTSAQPSSIFNNAALKAIKRWKFKPRIVDGVAFKQRAIQTLEFKLSQ